MVFFGRLADLYGRKRIFILGAVALAACSLGLAFINGVFDRRVFSEAVSTYAMCQTKLLTTFYEVYKVQGTLLSYQLRLEMLFFDCLYLTELPQS